MVQASSLISAGMKMSEFGNIYLFRFTDELQSRFEELLDKKKLICSLSKKKLNI
jgi:hypothetical protein